MKLGAYGVVRVGMGLLPEGAVDLALARGRHRVHQRGLRRALGHGADRPQVRHRVLVGVAHGARDAGRRHPDRGRAERLGVPDVRARHHDRALLRAGRARVREGALARDLQDGRLRPGRCRASPRRSPSAACRRSGCPATAGFVAELLTFMGAWRSDHRWWLCARGARHVPHRDLRPARGASQIFWGPPSPHFHDLADARGPEWVALVVLVVRADPVRHGAGARARPGRHRRPCRSSRGSSARDLPVALRARDRPRRAHAARLLRRRSSCAATTGARSGWLAARRRARGARRLSARARRPRRRARSAGLFVARRPGDLREAALPRWRRSSACSAGCRRPTRCSRRRAGEYHLLDPGVAPRDVRPRLRARPDPALRRVRADVDPALRPGRLRQARRARRSRRRSSSSWWAASRRR